MRPIIYPRKKADIKTAWERAGTEEEIANAVKTIGRALNVDGVVSIWLEERDEGVSLIDAVLIRVTVFPLFLTPLFYESLHVGAEAVVYEVPSGQAVWRNQFIGDTAKHYLKTGEIISNFFENLENAR